MSNRLRTGVVLLTALLGMTLGCSASLPGGPTPTPVTPAPVTPNAIYTVTAGTNAVAPGGQLSVSWTASTGAPLDWISLFRVSDPNTVYGWYDYTKGATSGTFTFSAPTQAGQYEFRYLLNDGYSDVARSSLVTVGPSL
jgi:hypothetical protein